MEALRKSSERPRPSSVSLITAHMKGSATNPTSSVKLYLKNSQETYTTGDIIHGEVRLALARFAVVADEAYISLRCCESYFIDGIEEQPVIHYERTIPLPVRSIPTGCSSYKVAFQFRLENDTIGMLPSCEVRLPGSIEPSGIIWTVETHVRLQNFEKTREQCECMADAATIRVQPMVPGIDDATTTLKSFGGVVTSNHRDKRLVVPKVVPQLPEQFDIWAAFYFEKPTLISTIRVTLATTYVIRTELGDKVRVEEQVLRDEQVNRTLMGRANISEYLRKLQLIKWEPRCFSSGRLAVWHSLDVGIDKLGEITAIIDILQPTRARTES